MMQGFDPWRLSDVVVSNGDPSDIYGGVSPDFSHEERMLTSAVLTGALSQVSGTATPPNMDTQVCVADLIPWLRLRGFDSMADGLDISVQDESGTSPDDRVARESSEAEHALLATPAELISAFHVWGLHADWFKTLKDRAWLLEARRVKGHGQRSHTVQPLFCPLAVMRGLATKTRSKSPMSLNKGWSILKREFPQVYAKNSKDDPRDEPG